MTMPALAEKSPPGGGYTLVEMVVVLAVMALAAAVIAPGLFRSETSGGERVVRTLTEVYAMAREAAVTRGGGAQVWVNADEGRWLALVRSGGTSRWDTLGSGSLQTPGVRLQSGGERWAIVRFDARGRAAGQSVGVRGPEGVAFLRPNHWTGRLDVARR